MVTGEVSEEVQRLVLVMAGDMRRIEMQEALELRHEDHFRDAYLKPALEQEFIEMTLPDKPTSNKQQYRLTKKGQLLAKKILSGR